MHFACLLLLQFNEPDVPQRDKTSACFHPVQYKNRRRSGPDPGFPINTED